MKSLGFILFFLILNLANANTCAQFFHGQLKYEFADPRLLGSRSVVLGEGLAGKVNLQSRPDTSNQFVVVKIYKFAPEEENSQFNNDLKAFQILNSLSSLPFALPFVEKIGTGIMQLSYHPGRTIEGLFYDSKAPEDVRIQVENRYIELLRETVKILEPLGYIKTVKHNELPRVVFQKGKLQIILKPDNFIVNPETLEITLIDPS